VLQIQTLRRLVVRDRADGTGAGHLSAASGLARVGDRLYVIADDENSLGVFDVSSEEPGRLVRVFDGDLPDKHDARKKAKPDLEALAHLPAFAGHPFGALLAIGSGSRANRCRGVLIALDATGGIQGAGRHLDLAPLFEPLRARFAQLNIEGAFVTGRSLCLLQRGNTASPVNACLSFDWHAIESWLLGAAPAPAFTSIMVFDLGLQGGVPLCFTDGAALPEGAWVFCAAAEDTGDSYADGACAGSVVGVVDAAGVLRCIEPLSEPCKAEGVTATLEDGVLTLLLVTDADDREVPASLLTGTLSQPLK